ncbi:MAG: hypothetical protein ACOYN3_02155 [Acidimicrobiia bacterium]
MVGTAETLTAAKARSRDATSASTHGDTRHPELRFAIVVTAMLATVLALLSWRHTPWRDELQAWAIARDAPSIRALFAQLRYEGHPALWYLLLWFPARAFRSITALQVLQWIIASGATLLVTWRAPFTRTVRVLLACSYLPLIEYGVIARSYALMWILALGALCVLGTRGGWWWSTALLALAANTTVLAIPLAFGIAVGCACDTELRARCRLPLAWRLRISGIALVGIAGVVSVCTARPGSDAQHATISTSFGSEHALSIATTPFRALAPIPGDVPAFWETHIATHLGWFGAAVSAAVVICMTWRMRSRPAAWVPWTMTTVGVVAILATHGLYASLRFSGVLFAAAIAGLWCMRLVQPRAVTPNRLAGALGLVGCIGTALTMPVLVMIPFSGAAAAANWVQVNYPTTPIVCDTAARCSAIAVRLSRTVRAPDMPEAFTYARFTNAAGTDSQARTLALHLARTTNSEVLLLTTDRPTTPDVVVLHHVNNSVVRDERYWISAIRP